MSLYAKKSGAKTILEKYRTPVLIEIQNYLREPQYPPLFKVPAKYKTEQDFHQELVNEYPLRESKYLRPTLLLLTCEALGYPKNQALKTAAAIQVSEEWLLIHDDIEDDSPLRRGEPALHKIYGVELALNAGDYLHILMWNILADNHHSLGPEKTFLIQKEFVRILSRTALGQTIEIKWIRDNKLDFTDEDWFQICDGKTSYYTVAGPMLLGATIADATQVQLNLIGKFGLYLGRAFQLQDDLLDLVSDFGGRKQQGNDIYEGKRTIMLGHLLKNISLTNRNRLMSITKKDRALKTPDDVKWVIEQMNACGSIVYAQNLAKSLQRRARQVFENDLNFLSHQPARDRIQTLIQFVLERTH